MKDSIGLGLAAVFELSLAVVFVTLNVAWAAVMCGGVSGFFTWGALEAHEDEHFNESESADRALGNND